jgi:hypothetical protein
VYLTELTVNIQRATQLMHRHDGLWIGFTDSELGLYEAREHGHVIGTAARLGTLVDLLETAERQPH